MIYRSKAPLRLGLAGGGTDVSPYSDLFGGAILNATISLFAHTAVEPTETGLLELEAADRNETESIPINQQVSITSSFQLVKGVYNAIQKQYPFQTKGLKITTYVDAPAGSGLGTSSTLVVSIIGAFAEMLQLPLGEYDMARLAFDVERIQLQLAGGKQDQYAATFGGVNYMEFFTNDKVIVNPLRIKNAYLSELENNLVLFYTDTSRESANIIKEQVKNVENNKDESIEAMHQLKEQALMMKESLLKGNLNEIGNILDYGFEQKRKIAANISNQTIEAVYDAAKKAGATGGKISGAGGGGFMMFYCPGNTRYQVIKTLENFGGAVKKYSFTKNGVSTWRS